MAFPDLKLLPLDVNKYELPESDQIRIADLMRILPKEGRTALDVGALTGYCSELLTQYFESITALDLTRPAWEFPGVTTVAGDITRLQFPDNSFDCVFCAEVLEHIPEVEKATAELARVTRRHVVIGTPFRQDLRLLHMTCSHCGRVTPAYGHVNSFDEAALKRLFAGLTPIATSFVLSAPVERTNALSVWLMDRAGNPYAPYDQLETCLHCHRKPTRPAERSVLERGCSFLAHRINRAQSIFAGSKPGWIHMVFRKDPAR